MVLQFSIFFAVALAVMLFGHWVLYGALVNFFQIQNSTWRMVLKIGLGLMAVSFLAASFLIFRFDNIFLKKFYYISAIWLGWFFYFLVAAAICSIIFWISGGNPNFPM